MRRKKRNLKEWCVISCWRGSSAFEHKKKQIKKNTQANVEFLPFKREKRSKWFFFLHFVRRIKNQLIKCVGHYCDRSWMLLIMFNLFYLFFYLPFFTCNFATISCGLKYRLCQALLIVLGTSSLSSHPIVSIFICSWNAQNRNFFLPVLPLILLLLLLLLLLVCHHHWKFSFCYCSTMLFLLNSIAYKAQWIFNDQQLRL